MLFKIFFILTLSFAKGPVKTHDSAQKVLESMTLTYSQVEYMKSNFNKLSKSMLLGTVEKTRGSLEYSKKKIRLEMVGENEGVFIKGHEKFWHISGKDVTTGSVKNAVPSIFDSIFSDVTIWSKLKVGYISFSKKTAKIKVNPKGKIPNILEIEMIINLKKRTLIQLNYTDNVNNFVEIFFKNIKFFSKARPKRFTYEMKKGDKISAM